MADPSRIPAGPSGASIVRFLRARLDAANFDVSIADMKSTAARSGPHRRYVQAARAEAAADTARRILEAFLARLMTQWFDQITLDRVADDAGVTVQTVVRRFGGKDGVVGELWLDGFTRLRAAIEAAPITSDPLRDLEGINIVYRQWALANATSYGIMFSRAVPEFIPSPEAKALAAGASYHLISPHDTMLASGKPAVAVCAVRTGSGKSQSVLTPRSCK